MGTADEKWNVILFKYMYSCFYENSLSSRYHECHKLNESSQLDRLRTNFLANRTQPLILKDSVELLNFHNGVDIKEM